MNISNQGNDAGSDTQTAIDRTINVYVKAKELFEVGQTATEDQIDTRTALTVNHGTDGQSDWTKHKNYEVTVYMNKQVTWDIKRFSPSGDDKEYEVKLVSVNHMPERGNPNFFNEEILNVGSDGNITATITNDPQLTNNDDSYTIKFTITYDGKEIPYVLDPKLKINS
jgi:hypothetical protein